MSLIPSCRVQEALRSRCDATMNDAGPYMYARNAWGQVHSSSAQGVTLLHSRSAAVSRGTIRSTREWSRAHAYARARTRTHTICLSYTNAHLKNLHFALLDIWKVLSSSRRRNGSKRAKIWSRQFMENNKLLAYAAQPSYHVQRQWAFLPLPSRDLDESDYLTENDMESKSKFFCTDLGF